MPPLLQGRRAYRNLQTTICLSAELRRYADLPIQYSSILKRREVKKLRFMSEIRPDLELYQKNDTLRNFMTCPYVRIALP